MDDDPFDRALRRERDLRDRLAAGEIGEDELEVLRSFDESVPEGVRLTLEQARRLVDEGVDPDVVVEVITQLPLISVDEAIEIIVEHELDVAGVRGLVGAGMSDALDSRQLSEILDNEITPDLLHLIVAAGHDPHQAVAVALELAHVLCDPQHTLEALRRAGLTGLTVEQIATIEDNEINPRVVRRLLDGDPALDVEGALRLLLNDDEVDERHDDRRSVGFVLDEAAVERSIAAVRAGVGLARDIARAVFTGAKNRNV